MSGNKYKVGLRLIKVIAAIIVIGAMTLSSLGLLGVIDERGYNDGMRTDEFEVKINPPNQWNTNIVRSEREGFSHRAETPSYSVFFGKDPSYQFICGETTLTYTPSCLQFYIEEEIASPDTYLKSRYDGVSNIIDIDEDIYHRDYQPKTKETIVDGNRIIYRNIYPNVDLVYEVGFFSLKEDYIIHAPFISSETTYVFSGKIETDTKLEPELSGDEDAKNDVDLVLRGEEPNQGVTLKSPLYYDSSDNQYAGQYSFEESENGIRYDIIVSSDILYSQDTIFPIHIDPITTPLTTEETHTDEEFTINSDIDINNGGILNLYNCILKFDDQGTPPKLSVNNGGTLNAYGTDFTREGTGDSWDFEFGIGSSGLLDNCIIEYFGDDGYGIRIRDDDVTISNCEISNQEGGASGKGIYVDQCSPDVVFNTITGTSDTAKGIDITTGAAPLVQGNTIKDWEYGIYIQSNIWEDTCSNTNNFDLTESENVVSSGTALELSASKTFGRAVSNSISLSANSLWKGISYDSSTPGGSLITTQVYDPDSWELLLEDHDTNFIDISSINPLMHDDIVLCILLNDPNDDGISIDTIRIFYESAKFSSTTQLDSQICEDMSPLSYLSDGTARFKATTDMYSYESDMEDLTNNGVLLSHFNDGSGQLASNEVYSVGGQLGSTRFEDSSDPEWTEFGRFGPCLEFDGTDDYVEFGDDGRFEGMDAITVSAWFYCDSLPTGSDIQTIVAKSTYSGSSKAFHIRLRGTDGLQFQVRTDTGYDCWKNCALPTANEWHHVAMTWSSGESVKCYLDGQYLGAGTSASGVVNDISQPLRVGRSSWSTGDYFNGRIDEVFITDYEMDEFDLLQPYQFGKIAHYRFDENAGQYLTDEIGFNTGVLGSTEDDDSNDPTWKSDGCKASCLDFDGTNDYAIIGEKIDDSYQGTVEAWVYPEDATYGQGHTILSYGGGDVASPGYLAFRIEGDGSDMIPKIMQMTDGGSGTLVYTTATIPTNQWSHVAFSSDGEAYKIFVNGVSKTLTVGAGTNNGNWFEDTTVADEDMTVLGCQRTDGTFQNYFEGMIDEVIVSNYPKDKFDLHRLGPMSNEPEMVAFYRLDSGDGDYIYDEINDFDSNMGSTVGSDGADPTWVEGKWGKALDFDGADYIDIGSDSLLDFGSTDDFTLECWIQRGTLQCDGSYHAIVGKGSIYDNGYGIHIYERGDQTIRPEFWIRNGGSYTVQNCVIPDIDWAVGTWMHLAGVYDGTNIYMYVNGQLIGQKTATVVPNSASKSFKIGDDDKSTSPNSKNWDGLIDEVIVTAKAKHDFNIDTTLGYINDESSIISGYRFDDGSGDETDISGEGLDGTVYADTEILCHFDEGTGITYSDETTNGNDGTVYGTTRFISNMDELDSGKIIDESGFGNDGTVSGATLDDDGLSGKCLTFDGSYDYVSVAGNVEETRPQEFTLSAWINPTSADDHDNILSKAVNYYSSPYYSYGLKIHASGRIAVLAATGGSETACTTEATETVPFGEWSYVTGTYDGSKLKVYINGVLMEEYSTSGVITYNTNPVYIGQFRSNACFFDGKIDEVSILGRALTADEISEEYYKLRASIIEDKGTGIEGNCIELIDNSFLDYGDIAFMDTPGYFSVEAWIMRYQDMNDATSNGVDNVIVAQSSGTTNDNFEIGTDGSYIEIYMDSSTGADTRVEYDAGIQNNVWYHIIATYDKDDSNELKLYLDGEQVQQWSTFSGNLDSSSTSPLTLGCARPDNQEWGDFNGKIDEFAIHERALTSEEVRAHYDASRAMHANYQKGVFGQRFNFDGNEYITVSNFESSDIRSYDITVRSDTVSSDEYIFYQSSDFYLKLDSTGRVVSKIGTMTLTSTSDIDDSLDHKIRALWYPTSAWLYIDTVNEATVTSGSLSGLGSNMLYIGRNSGGTSPFSGAMDDLIFRSTYSRDLFTPTVMESLTIDSTAIRSDANLLILDTESSVTVRAIVGSSEYTTNGENGMFDLSDISGEVEGYMIEIDYGSGELPVIEEFSLVRKPICEGNTLISNAYGIDITKNAYTFTNNLIKQNTDCGIDSNHAYITCLENEIANDGDSYGALSTQDSINLDHSVLISTNDVITGSQDHGVESSYSFILIDNAHIHDNADDELQSSYDIGSVQNSIITDDGTDDCLFITSTELAIVSCQINDGSNGIRAVGAGNKNIISDTTFDGNIYSIYATSSSNLILDGCLYENTDTYDVYVSASSVGYHDMDITTARINFIDTTSKLYNLKRVSIDTNREELLTVKNEAGSTVYEQIIPETSGQMTTYLASTYYFKPSSIEMEYDTPHQITYGSNNDLYLPVMDDMSLTLQIDGDSDGDGLTDSTEDNQYLMLFEAEDIVDVDKIIGGAAVQNNGDTYIFQEEFPFDRQSVDVRFLARAKALDDTAVDPELRLSFPDYASSETQHYVTTEYQWYWSKVQSLGTYSDYLELKAVDVDGSQTLAIDQVIIVDVTNDDRNICEYTQPYLFDTDNDGLSDSDEITSSRMWFEAEHHITGDGSSSKNTNAFNGITGVSGHDTNTIVSRSYTFTTEDYFIFVRSYIDDIGDTISVYVGGDTLTPENSVIEDEFVWYKFDFEDGYSGSSNIEIKTNSGNLIDAFYVMKSDEVLIETVDYDGSPITPKDSSQTLDFSGDDVDTDLVIKIPEGAEIKSAIFTFAETSLSATTLQDDASGNVDAYGGNYDMDGRYIVYQTSTGNDINLYDIYTKEDTKIADGSNPRIQGKFVIYEIGTNAGIGLYEIGSSDGANPYTIRSGASSTFYHPDVYGDYIVWLEDVGTYYDLNLMNVNLDADFDGIPNYKDVVSAAWDTVDEDIDPVYDSEINPPRLYNNIVTYLDNGAVKYGVYTFTAEVLDDNQDTDDFDSFIKTVKSDTDIHYPNIWGDYIVYLINGQFTSDLFLYNIRTNTISTLESDVPDAPVCIDSNQVLHHQDIFLLSPKLCLHDLIRGTEKTLVTDWDNYALSNGNVVFKSDSQTALKGFLRDFSMKIPFNTYIETGPSTGALVTDAEVWSQHGLFPSTVDSIDFADYLNSYCSKHAEEVDSGYLSIPIHFYREIDGEMTINGFEMDLDTISTSINSDLDLDGMEDGDERNGIYGCAIHEIEDSIDYKESINPMVYLDNDGIGGKDFKIKDTKFFYQTGAMMTALWWHETDDEPYLDNSWIKIKGEAEKTGEHKFVLERKNTYDRFTPKGPQALTTGMQIDEQTYITTGVQMIEPEMDEETLRYLESVANSVAYARYSHMGSLDSAFLGIDVTLVDVRLYPEEVIYGSEDDYALFCVMDFSSTQKLVEKEGYIIEIGCDFSLLPDEMNPELRSTCENTLVPESFSGALSSITLYDLDSIRVYGPGLDPMLPDTDSDGLMDGDDTEFPLAADADGDGLDDHQEVIDYHTSPAYRDTDYDGIRDGVECGLAPGDIGVDHSPGSWTERIAHSTTNHPFDFDRIYNWDSDHDVDRDGDVDGSDTNPAIYKSDPLNSDTDNDGLPDGWRDGWRYFDGDFTESDGYLNSMGFNLRTPIGSDGSVLEHYFMPTLHNRYDERLWGYYGENNNRIQVYEGEDFNCDGYTDRTDASGGCDLLVLTFNEGEGQDISDSSGNGYYGRLGSSSSSDGADPTWVDGITGKALSFDGGDYVPINLGFTDPGEISTMTAYAWFKTSESGTGSWDNWAFLDFDRSEYFNIFIRGDNGRLGFSTKGNGGSINDLYGTTAVNDGDWHFMCAVYDGTDKIIYLDGVEEVRASNPHGGAALGSGNDRYGYVGDGSEATSYGGSRNSKYFTGTIDEVALYTKAFTPSEVLKHYEARQAQVFFEATWEFEAYDHQIISSIEETCNGPGCFDSDGDGISDGYETWYATRDPIYHYDAYGLNPLDADDATNDLENPAEDYSDTVSPAVSSSRLCSVPTGMKVDMSSTKRYFTSVSFELTTTLGLEPVLELRADNQGSPNNLLFTAPLVATQPGSFGTEHIYDIEDEEYFFNLMEGSNGIVWIALVPNGANYNWNLATTPDTEFFPGWQNTGSWSQISPTTYLSVKFYYDIDGTGDGLTNLEEYLIGTNPKNDDTDSDGLTDDLELDGEFGTNKKIFDTNIPDGAVGYYAYGYGSLDSSSYVIYNEDPYSDNTGVKYVYDTTITDLDSETYETMTCLRLADLTRVLITHDSDPGTYLYIGSEAHTNYYRFKTPTSATMDNDLVNRGREAFISDPWREDSDKDGASDYGEYDIVVAKTPSERAWTHNYDNYGSGTDQRTLMGWDKVMCVRDDDSDNDGMMDGYEPGWNLDSDGLGLEVATGSNSEGEDDFHGQDVPLVNMIDFDSDGDGLWDYYEKEVGTSAVNNPDSDNDGLCDGFVEAYIWDPLDTTYSDEGSFVKFTDFETKYDEYYGTFPLSESTGFQKWEGEDQDVDGVIDEGETNPTLIDTDGDLLTDGYDIVYESDPSIVWYLGEYYFHGFSDEYSQSSYGYRQYMGTNHQNADTDPLNSDTDFDTRTDGMEVIGCDVNGLFTDEEIIYYPETLDIWRPPETAGLTGYVKLGTYPDYLISDPSVTDTDNDGLYDGEDIEEGLSPIDTDTDDDGLDDDHEIDLGTKGWHYDTDRDMIPDGYVENWWRGSDGKWKKYSSQEDPDGDSDANVNPWEGEEVMNTGGSYTPDLYIKGDTSYDRVWSSSEHWDETDPMNADCDGDGIKDGVEFFFDYIIGIMDPTATTFTGNSHYDADNDGDNNPVDEDSDGDNLLDSDEDLNHDGKMEATASGSTYPTSYTSAYESNPYDDDTDADNVDDDEDWTVDEETYNYADLDGDGKICMVDSDSDGDTISDGYPDTEIYIYGEPDDDEGVGDGLDDDLEYIILGCDEDLLDTDGDGLEDGEEILLGTDPTEKDTDGDGLSDGYEYTTHTSQQTRGIATRTTTGYENAWISRDRDGDGVLDGWSDYPNKNGQYDTGEGWGEEGDPNYGGIGGLGTDWGDGYEDTDGDGLLDGNPFEVKYEYDADNNIWEIVGHRNTDGDKKISGLPLYNVFDTDSDGDNIDDTYENVETVKPISIGDEWYVFWDDNRNMLNDEGDWPETSPIDIDSDDDGLPDGWVDGWIYTEPYLGTDGLYYQSYYDPENTGILQAPAGWIYQESSENDCIDPWEGEDWNSDGIVNVRLWEYDDIESIDLYRAYSTLDISDDHGYNENPPTGDNSFALADNKYIEATFAEDDDNAFYYSIGPSTSPKSYDQDDTFSFKIAFRTPTQWSHTQNRWPESYFGLFDKDDFNDRVAFKYASDGLYLVVTDNTGVEETENMKLITSSIYSNEQLYVVQGYYYKDSGSNKIDIEVYVLDNDKDGIDGRYRSWAETVRIDPDFSEILTVTNDFDVDSIGLFTLEDDTTGDEWGNPWKFILFKSEDCTNNEPTPDYYWQETSPFDPDYNDDDGMLDGMERYYEVSPFWSDWDLDGLKDGEEIKHKCDPKNPDTDNDLISDLVEIMDYRTDPNKPDSDSDGFPDYLEATHPDLDPTATNDWDTYWADYIDFLRHQSKVLHMYSFALSHNRDTFKQIKDDMVYQKGTQFWAQYQNVGKSVIAAAFNAWVGEQIGATFGVANLDLPGLSDAYDVYSTGDDWKGFLEGSGDMFDIAEESWKLVEIGNDILYYGIALDCPESTNMWTKKTMGGNGVYQMILDSTVRYHDGDKISDPRKDLDDMDDFGPQLITWSEKLSGAANALEYSKDFSEFIYYCNWMRQNAFGDMILGESDYGLPTADTKCGELHVSSYHHDGYYETYGPPTVRLINAGLSSLVYDLEVFCANLMQNHGSTDVEIKYDVIDIEGLKDGAGWKYRNKYYSAKGNPYIEKDMAQIWYAHGFNAAGNILLAGFFAQTYLHCTPPSAYIAEE